MSRSLAGKSHQLAVREPVSVVAGYLTSGSFADSELAGRTSVVSVASLARGGDTIRVNRTADPGVAFRTS